MVDGHHSIAAARDAGEKIEWVTASTEIQQEVVYLGAEEWMSQRQLDSDWYDVFTGRDVW